MAALMAAAGGRTFTCSTFTAVAAGYTAYVSYQNTGEIDWEASIMNGISVGLLVYTLGMSIYGFYLDYCTVKGYTPVTHIGGSGIDLKTNMQLVAEKGKAGEAISGLTKNKKHIPSLSGTASFRIPDGLTKTTLSEVKNYSGTLSYTAQLRDFVTYSQAKGLQMHLYTNAKLSGPLQQLVDDKIIKLFPLIS